MSRARYETSRKANPSTPHAGSNTVGSGDDFSEKAATYEKATGATRSMKRRSKKRSPSWTNKRGQRKADADGSKGCHDGRLLQQRTG